MGGTYMTHASCIIFISYSALTIVLFIAYHPDGLTESCYWTLPSMHNRYLYYNIIIPAGSEGALIKVAVHVCTKPDSQFLDKQLPCQFCSMFHLILWYHRLLKMPSSASTF